MSDYERAVATQIMATHCCFCGRPLVDAESVQRGIGPICKGKYAIGDITDDSLKEALGVVAANEAHLGGDLVGKIIGLRHDGGKDAGRQIANLVIYHASARRAESLFVLKCAEVLDAVGYETAGTQLRKNYARISIVENDGRLEIYTPYKQSFSDACRDFPKKLVYDDTKTTRDGRPKFKCWSIRKDDLDLMLPLLGWFFDGEAAVVEGKPVALKRPDRIDTIQAQARQRKADRKASWNAKQTKQNGNGKPKPAPAPVANAAVITLENDTSNRGYIRVFAPYNPDFTGVIRNVPRRKAVWDRSGPKDKFVCWSVPAGKRSEVIQMVADHFGLDATIDDQT